MKLKEDQISKIDPLLEEALINAKGDEKMRVIMTLGNENQLRNNQSISNLKNTDFSSPVAYRQALIEQRKNQLSQIIGDTVKELQKLSLTTQGGTISRVLVVEGSATDILKSLELSGVHHVSLDHLVGLSEIVPDEAVNHFAQLYIKILGIELDKKTQKLIYQAAKQYILNYQKRYNRLRVLGMSQPVNLDDIYTEVQCLQPDEVEKFTSLAALEESYRQNSSSRLTNQKSAREDGIKIANQYQYLMILGQPGAGKSTFLRKIGLETLKGNSGQIQGETIPVLLELKQFTGNKVNIYNIIEELARTPLLLTFLCLEYDESQNLPKNRATLYGNALDILLRRWAAEKRLPNEPGYQQLGIDLEKIMLAEIAYNNFAADKLFFSQQEVLNQIQKFLASNYNTPKNLDDGKLLDVITIEQGILVERARDVFSFSHLTLQEYLTAQYIYDYNKVNELVTEHLTDKRWQEVFLLVAGVMRGGADNLLLLMEREVQKYINTPKLQALLNLAEKVTVGSEGNYKPVGKRAVAIAYANAYANAYAYANAKLNPLAIPHHNQPEKVHQDFARNLIKTILEGFNLSPEMVDLSKKEINALDNYLYANYLIIQCKDAAVRVSPATWEAIEDRMLLGNK
ncbi:MAG: NACHT domain-containing protein [Cuspidothrix sp.]